MSFTTSKLLKSALRSTCRHPTRYYRGEKSLKQTAVQGVNLLREPALNKGMAFTIEERQMLRLHGLLPPTVIDQDLQLERSLLNFNQLTSDLEKYIYLTDLQVRNKKLFYRILIENIEQMMPIVYTPTVGEVCLKYGMIYRQPRGLYITINDLGYVYDILCNWPEQDIEAIVVTDGERVLGLGDLGAYGMGICVGKLALYTALAGVQPHQSLPVCIDVGTDNQKLLDDKFYIGLRHNRVRDERYDALIEEFMEAVKRKYGNFTLVQFEDFANMNAFKFLERYRNQYCTFNDDIQGTAAVAVSGLLSSLRITGVPLKKNKFLFLGAGGASTGIAMLLHRAMVDCGMTSKDAYANIYLVDKEGLLVESRTDHAISKFQRPFCKDLPQMSDYKQVIDTVKPTAILGATGSPGLISHEIIRKMSEWNERPIIFALSNPTSCAECTAEEAYTISEGRVVFASGSPFHPVEVNGRTFHPGQGNNAYVFPAMALAAMTCRVKHITEHMFLKCAQFLAEMVTEEDLQKGLVYPPLSAIREDSIKLATRLAEYSYRSGIATYYPEPMDKDEFIRSQVYDYTYQNYLPKIYPWPEAPKH